MSKSLLQSADIKNLKVEGDTSLHNLTINGTHTLNGSNTITKDLTVEGLVNLNDQVSIGGDLTVEGKHTIKDEVNISGDLTVNGTLTVNGKIICDTLEVKNIIYNGHIMTPYDTNTYTPIPNDNFLVYNIS